MNQLDCTLEHADVIDEAVRVCMGEMLQVPVGDTACAQMRLRVNDSGLGLYAVKDIAPGAYLASVTRMCQNFHLVFRASAGDDSSYVHRLIAANTDVRLVNSAVSAIKKIELIEGRMDGCSLPQTLQLFKKDAQRLQKLLSRRVLMARKEQFRLSAEWDGAALARMSSACDPDGNACLFALPSIESTTISSWQWRVALNDRLGQVSACIDELVGRACVCARRTEIDGQGAHPRSCPLVLKEHIQMHNDCVGLLASLAVRFQLRGGAEAFKR